MEVIPPHLIDYIDNKIKINNNNTKVDVCGYNNIHLKYLAISIGLLVPAIGSIKNKIWTINKIIGFECNF